MRHLAIIETDENGVFIGVVQQYFEIEPKVFDQVWAEYQKAVIDWADLTKRINYGLINYLHSIGALWMDENGAFQVDFKNFTAASFIDGLMANTKYLPEEMTGHMVYMILEKAIKTVKKMFPKGRVLPIDIGKGLQYLGPLLPTYVAYSRKDAEISRLFDTLLPQLETFLQPLTQTDDVSTAE